MKWDEWRGNGKPAMWLKRVLYWPRTGWRLDLHKFVGNDDPECFHTHPSICIRLILWNGYTEEVLHPEGFRQFKDWRMGMVGIVRPEFCHRQHELRNGKPCYTAWLRLKPTVKVELRGTGWPKGTETMSKSRLDARAA